MKKELPNKGAAVFIWVMAVVVVAVVIVAALHFQHINKRDLLHGFVFGFMAGSLVIGGFLLYERE